MAVSAVVRQAMESTNALFCSQVVGKGDIGALDGVYTSEATILPPGADLVKGREAIQRFWGSLVRDAGLRRASLETVDAEQAGDCVIEIGRAALMIQAAGQAETHATVKYVVVWRQEGGQWKWHIDIWNPNA